MANTTFTSVTTNYTASVVAAAPGTHHNTDVVVKAFTATCGTGTYPVAGLTLDLSGLFANKVLMAVISPLHDPARDTGDYAYPAVYVPAANGAPATGVVKAYTSNGAAPAALVMIPDVTATIDGFVVTGFAIGY